MYRKPAWFQLDLITLENRVREREIMSASWSGPGPRSPISGAGPPYPHGGKDRIREWAEETERLGVRNPQRSVTVSVRVDDVHELGIAGI